MKKLICLILCIVLSSLALVSCGEDPIGDYLENYEKPVEKEKLSLNLYIVADICENEDCKNTDYVNCQHRSSDKRFLKNICAHFFTTIVNMTRSSSPVLTIECSDPWGQMCITPGFRSSSIPSQNALPVPLII